MLQWMLQQPGNINFIEGTAPQGQLMQSTEHPPGNTCVALQMYCLPQGLL
jgi:hypothetical protein